MTGCIAEFQIASHVPGRSRVRQRSVNITAARLRGAGCRLCSASALHGVFKRNNFRHVRTVAPRPDLPARQFSLSPPQPAGMALLS
jgi:hypothetical protein